MVNIQLVLVVEAYRLDRYDNLPVLESVATVVGCRSLSFG